MTNIHPTAIVDPNAELDTDVSIGAYAIIGKNVKIAKNTSVHAHALVQGYTSIGENNQIFSFAAIGNPPQDLKYKGEHTELNIGNNNIIREYVTMQPGTIQGGGSTIIGNENLFMAYVHIAHDCMIGHQNVIANGVQLAGHVTIHNQAVLGGLAAVHQFVVIGDMALIGGGSMIKLDLPPYCIADGFPASLRGLNNIALQRRNISTLARSALKNAYKAIFLSQFTTVEEAIKNISAIDLAYSEVQYLLSFIKNSKRGILRPKSSNKYNYENLQ